MSDTPSDSVLDLGRMLVQELDEGSQRDTLARWMCHHVAERIENAESSGRAAVVDDARRAVLDLWEHRSSLPRDSRPLRDFGLVFRTLEALDPTDPSARYFSAVREVAKAEAEDKDDGEDSVTSWLLLAEGMDHAARLLIRECLRGAAKAAGGDVTKWIQAAEEAGFTVDPDLRTVRVLLRLDRGEPDRRDETDRARLEDLLQKLESFRELSAILEQDLREQRSDGPAGE